MAPGSDGTWKDYEHEVARVFHALDRDARVGVEVDGVRARHKVDVVVDFLRDGVPQRWIVECKHHRRRVEKLHVLALQTLVQDVGASAGLLMSEAGFQPGAHAAAARTNVLLMSVEELKSRNGVVLPEPGRAWQALAERFEEQYGPLGSRLAQIASGAPGRPIPVQDALALQRLVVDAAEESARELRLQMKAGRVPTTVEALGSRELPGEPVVVVLADRVVMESGYAPHADDVEWARMVSGFESLLRLLDRWRSDVVGGHVLLIPVAIADEWGIGSGRENGHLYDYRWVEQAIVSDQ
jgi:restriction endonuclease